MSTIADCAGVRAKLFWLAIYYANMRPGLCSQSIYWYRRGLGRRYLQIVWEYDLVDAILIRSLTQPRMCEMGYSIFSAMSRLKFVSTMRASFPSMPSTKMTNEEKIRCSWQFLPCLYLFSFYHRSRTSSVGSFL